LLPEDPRTTFWQAGKSWQAIEEERRRRSFSPLLLPSYKDFDVIFYLSILATYYRLRGILLHSSGTVLESNQSLQSSIVGRLG
jgi:hypothetical protein